MGKNKSLEKCNGVIRVVVDIEGAKEDNRYDNQ